MLLIPDAKAKYKNKEIISFAVPGILYLPLSSYRGDFSPLVHKGDRVLKYQVLAGSEGMFAGAIHAPVSGTIGEIVYLNEQAHLELYNDFQEEEELTLPRHHVADLSLDDFIKELLAKGIEGSGGARFPTSLKYKIGSREIDTLIINGAECEGFLSADYAIMKKYSHEIARVAALIQRLVSAKKVVIAIEKQNSSLKCLLEEAFKNNAVKGDVMLLPDFYPQGGELQLIRSITGKMIPKGTVPADHGVLVNNVGTIWAIYKAIFEGRPYIERLVTLYDEKDGRGGNYWIRIGTPFRFMHLNFFSGSQDDHYSFVLGGPMMGRPIEDPRTPVHKGSGGLLRLKKQLKSEQNCIGCGYCADVCPQQLLPLELARNSFKNDADQLKYYNLMDCIECGACAYICPATVPLMEGIRAGKKLLMN